MTLPSGPGQTDAAHSLSVTPASDASFGTVGGATAAKQDTLISLLGAQMGPSKATNLYALAVSTTIVVLAPGAAMLADIAAGAEFVVTAEGCDIWWYCDALAATGEAISKTSGTLAPLNTVPDYLAAGMTTAPMRLPLGTLVIAAIGAANGMLRFRRVT